ncbi:MAG: hypothetical protein AB7G37_19130 [Solirubrobacteraceae bacterium]
MRDAKLARLLLDQHGVVSFAPLRDLGFRAGAIQHRVRPRRLFRIHRGVYSSSPVLSEWGSRRAALLAVDRGHGTAVLSHRSALAALDPGFDRGSTCHHVTIRATGARRPGGVIVHATNHLPESDVRLVRRVALTTTARAVLDIARDEPVAEVRRLVRELQFGGLLAPDELARACAAHPTHRGVSVVRLADPVAHDADGGARTPLHDRVRRLIRDAGLAPFAEEAPLVGASGARYRADFARDDLMLVVEADGRRGHLTPAAIAGDRRRDADLGAAGWQTFRVASFDLTPFDRPGTIRLLRGVARDRGRRRPAAGAGG